MEGAELVEGVRPPCGTEMLLVKLRGAAAGAARGERAAVLCTSGKPSGNGGIVLGIEPKGTAAGAGRGEQEKKGGGEHVKRLHG